MGRVKLFNSSEEDLDTANSSRIFSTSNQTGTLEDLFIPKTDFSKNPPENFLTCYVLDGGDSTNQPCDES